MLALLIILIWDILQKKKKIREISLEDGEELATELLSRTDSLEEREPEEGVDYDDFDDEDSGEYLESQYQGSSIGEDEVTSPGTPLPSAIKETEPPSFEPIQQKTTRPADSVGYPLPNNSFRSNPVYDSDSNDRGFTDESSDD